MYGTTSNRKYKKFVKDAGMVTSYIFVVNEIISAKDLNEMRKKSFLHYEDLRHDRSGTGSVRIKNGRVERLILKVHDNDIEITLLEINEAHYGKKK